MGLDPRVYKNFITESERLELLRHSSTIPLQFNPIKAPLGTRNFRRIDQNKFSTYLVEQLFERIIDTLNLNNPTIDPMLGQIVSVIKPGGFIHLHRDLYRRPEFKDNHNLRFNIMVDRGTDISYNPIIDGKVYEVNKCDAWCFSATKYPHKTDVVSGPENRVVYQFGFIV